MWQESGGPPVTEPQRRGFGRKVLGRLTAGALEGDATLEYRRDGVVWSLVAPWDRIVAATGPGGCGADGSERRSPVKPAGRRSA